MSPEQAQANLRVLAEQIYAVEPNNTHRSILIFDGSRGDTWGRARWLPMVLLQIPTALILLIACANVANMLLARGTTRQKDIAIRRAMGASRGDAIRQLLVESSLLALLAGTCGVLLAHWFCAVLRNVLPLVRTFSIPTAVDGRILLFAMLGSLGLVLVFGLAPALRISRPDVMATLKDGSGAITALTRRWSLRNFLVVAQVTVSVIAIAFGALCIRSVHKLHVADPGYDSDRVLGVTVDFGRDSSATVDAGQFFADLQERVASFPNVRAVSLATNTPLSIGGHFKTGASHIDNFQMYAYRDRGLETVRPKRQSGRPPKLPDSQEPSFKKRVLSGPTEADGVCTLRAQDVRRILEEEFGIHYTLAGVYDLMHRLGLSCLTPRPRHRKNGPEQMQAWLEETPFLSSESAKNTATSVSKSGARTRHESASKAP